MLYSIKEIKKIRKQHGMTQGQLAKASGVSQSLIAKIEAGTLDPTNSKTKRIFETLETLSRQETKKAQDFMQKKVIACKKDDAVKKVIQIMKKNSISQMPVLEKNSCIGRVSERIIIDTLTDDMSKETKVERVMADAPPTVPPKTPIETLISLLKTYSLILITKKGRILGLITRADLLNSYQ